MQISGLSLSATADVFRAITGWAASPEELLEVGERGSVLQRLINIEDGIDTSEDRLPLRFFSPSRAGSRCGIEPARFSAALQRYYELRGYTSDGHPTAQTTKRLGLTAQGAT